MYFLRRSLHDFSGKSGSRPKQIIKVFHGKLVGNTLDEFTSKLTQKKAFKWSIQKWTQTEKNNYLSANKSDRNKKDYVLKQLTIGEINLRFQESTQEGNNCELVHLIRQCIKLKKCPSLPNLTCVVTLCAQQGNKDAILLIKELCQEFYPDYIKSNSYFKHFLAEAVWIRGNISESLKIFKEVYIENVTLRRPIRLMFKHLVQDIITVRSEAALIEIVKFAEELLKSHKDFFPLTCVWQTCFLSEWFSDQCLALELLETNEGLCKYILHRIPYVINFSLNRHKTEVVCRLLEFLLKYNMRTEYSIVLSGLLDYHISQGDLRRATEIIRWSLSNDILLPVYQNETFLNLLLNNNKESSQLRAKINQIKKKRTNRDLKF